MSDAPFVRAPALSGERLVFVADDDLFLTAVPDSGAPPPASRLSGGDMLVATPRFSPDGEWIAFTGRRDGIGEAYVVPTAGGEVRRLTYLGDPSTAVTGWRAGAGGPEVLVTSAAGEPTPFRTWLRAVPLSGGTGERLPYGPVTSCAIGPSGVPTVLGVHQSRSRGAAWKRYRGGTAPALWIDAAGEGTFARFLSELDGQIEDPALVGGRIAFISDHEGVGNVYSVTADGGDLRRHSDHVDFYARALSSDGRRLVYQCAGDCYLLDDLARDAEARRLELRLAGTRRGRARARLRAEEHLGAVAPDAEARASAVEVRGGIYLLTHREGPVQHLGAGGAARGRLPVICGKGALAPVAFVTDAEGEDALEIVQRAASGATRRRRLGRGMLGRVRDLAVAPDGGTLACATHDGRVLVVEVATGELRELDRSSDGEATGLTFSPDARLLAWSHAGPDPLRQIRLARLEDAFVHEATPLRFEDRDPAFSADGRYLAFLSVRTFDPFYDAHVFDLAFASATRPYLIPLAAGTPPPFGPEIGGRARPGEKGDDAGREPGAIALDLDGLAERVVALPVAAGRYRALRAVEGGLCYLAEPLVGVLGEEREGPAGAPPRAWLQRYDFAERRETTLVDALDAYAVSGDGRSLVVADDKVLRLLPATRRVEPEDDEAVEIDLGRLRVELDPVTEWRQMFDEAARLMRDHYFVADMSGVDWESVVARYRPLVARVATRDELSELIWEVQGELGTSHAYETPPSPAPDPARLVGFLGADVERRGDELVVTRVVPAESSVAAARSPLARAGVRAGDALLAVDGVAIDPALGVGPLLVGTAEQPVALSVRTAGDEQPHEVVVTPLRSERALRYQDSVASRRRRVHELSDGRAGYVHIPDMVGSGWAEFHRDLRLEVAREALVVDVRANRGGHVSELVIEKLARTVRAWELARHRATTTYPHDAPRGPLVALADEWAGSDGDIVTAAFKLYGLGPVVGTRTWGGVIGIDALYDLVDGTVVTQPRYAFYFDGPLGWSVENHGVDPDIEVPITPQDWVAGADPQLETAVATVLAELERRPAARPPAIASRPDRRPPTLGPRP